MSNPGEHPATFQRVRLYQETFLSLLTILGEQVFSTGGTGGASCILYSVRSVGAPIGLIMAWHYLAETQQGMYRAIRFSFFIASGVYVLFPWHRTCSGQFPISYRKSDHIIRMKKKRRGR